MAPNRKNLAVDSISELIDASQLQVQAKYLPLTAQLEQQTPIQQPAVQVGKPQAAPAVVEAKKDLFSLSHLEANLVKDAQRRATDNTPVIRANDESSQDYWAERVETRVVQSEANASVSNNTGYWDWPEDASAVRIALLLKEELARDLTSASRMEANLVKDAAKAQHHLPQEKAENNSYWGWTSGSDTPATHHADAGVVNESYWEWNTPASEAQQKQDLIESLLAYEQRRAMFSADHIEKNLQKEAQDNYWYEPAFASQQPQVATAPCAGYWDGM